MPVFPFNPQQHALSTPRERLPRGWYPAVIESSEIVPTAAKDGFRLILGFLIIDGPGKGRKVQNGYNIDNPSAKAVEISMSEIKTICSCIGKFNPLNQSEELHNIPLQILLTEPKDSDFNDVKGYKTIQGQNADEVMSGSGSGPAVGHQPQPPQGFGQPPVAQTPYPPAPPAAPAEQISPDGKWKLVNGAWVPNTPAAPLAPPAPAAAPAWAPPAPPAPPAAPAYAAPAPPPPTPAAAPAWAPGGPQPQAPAWAPPR